MQPHSDDKKKNMNILILRRHNLQYIRTQEKKN